MESNTIYQLISATLLLAIEVLYFRIADHYNIIDKPNHRSSHTQPIIRGGGIIFVFGVLIWFYESDFQWPWFVLAVLLIAVISFLDDVTTLNALVRFGFHLIAVLLLMYQLWPLAWPIYLLILAGIVCIGTLNAFNFMDGINGISGVYALVAIGTFGGVHVWVKAFTNTSLLWLVGISLLVFLFFNFRTRARCFGGDVGSVTMALILIFLLLQLIQATGYFLWPLMFLVYGVDSIITIVYRLKRKENIFEAHRTHLYQYFSNELKIPHLVVSSVYGLLQMFINAVVVYSFTKESVVIPIALALGFVFFYLFIRVRVMKRISLQS